MRTLFFILSGIFLLVGCKSQTEHSPKVKTGAEVLLDEHLGELNGKRVGLLMNPTSRVDGVHMLDTLMSLGVNVTSLFAAEHGFRGEAGAGEKIEDGIDQQTGLPVHSLYGSTRKPTSEMLENVDLILLDLPDMGVRFYTYNSTMGLVMEAMAAEGKELWILDRPDPLGGDYVAGWTLQEEFRSFVGSYPIPVIYGLTMGEIAQMAVGEGYLDLKSPPSLRIIKAEGWERDKIWPETGLEWIAPSPNLPSFEHLYAYTGTVIFEGTNLSEGRGTTDPFLQIGSPTLAVPTTALKKLEQKHRVQLDTVSFIPESIPGMALHPKWEGERCYGFGISFDDNYKQTDPLQLGLDLLMLAKEYDPNFRITSFANKLFGINLKSIIDQNREIPSWTDDVASFIQKRKPYLLYD
ncbi:exo-beta-N-acetylmuramidase NamZ family protein [Gracilimonas tropica]|uniref:exo-beta-N-acetylmuramidase NamZ family protein n=1 Tax=Gracilimonas tropica TaxID=454600 RepID=UPI00035DAF9E|nr:DUF1343 domain-containing protein [Gracilimonas tropica]